MGAYVHLEILTILRIHLIKKKIYIYEIWGLNPTYTKNQLVYWPNEKKKPIILEHSHQVSSNYSILLSQNLFYHLYHTILQHS